VGRVQTSVVVPGRIAEAEALWFDPERWPAFVEGFSHVVSRDEAWPQDGTIAWDSKPHGRGRVLERVTSFEARTGQTAEVEDGKLRGTQTVAFAAEGDDTRVTLSLDYRLKERNPLTPLVDALFVRRALGDSLRRTLDRFANERRGDLELM
jgi:hypothetical protein